MEFHQYAGHRFAEYAQYMMRRYKESASSARFMQDVCVWLNDTFRLVFLFTAELSPIKPLKIRLGFIVLHYYVFLCILFDAILL